MVPPQAIDGPTAVPTKQPADSWIDFVGWVEKHPTIATRATGVATSWHVRSLSSTGWLDVADLPDGGTPVTDGRTVATNLDP